MINIQEIPKTSGIYKITSPTNKIYIGQSMNVRRRLDQYKRLECKRQPKLYSSLSKYGFDNHIFEIIEECPESYLDELEIWWKYYYGIQCVENGLCCSYQDKKRGFISENCKRSISNGRKNKGFKEILQYDLEGNFIKEWKSASDISENIYGNRKRGTDITQCCLLKKKSSLNFQWRYKIDNYPLKIKSYKENLSYVGRKHSFETRVKRSNSLKGNIQTLETINKRIKKINKYVLQYDLGGNFIKEFNSIKEVGLYLKIKKPSNISKCCIGKQKTAYGFVWKFKLINEKIKENAY